MARPSRDAAASVASAPDRLLSILACPICKAALIVGGQLVCSACGTGYDFVDGIPALFHPESIFAGVGANTPAAGGPAGPTAHQFVSSLQFLDPPYTRWLNKDFFNLVNQCPSGTLMLNLGSGLGLFDKLIGHHLQPVNLDVSAGPGTHLLGDAHYLPFASESLDAVFSNAVLEHVQRPWIVAEEIFRVLKPTGRVFVNVPFLNIIHHEHDYYRFTDRGLDVLFARFQKIAGGVSAGPASFIAPFFATFGALWFPPGILNKLAALGLTWLFAPCKYLDAPLQSRPSMRLIADGFYFVGLKAEG